MTMETQTQTQTFEVRAEIHYNSPDGKGWIHSDIDPSDVDEMSNPNSEYRKFIHKALDEWLNKSRGTGEFYIGDPTFINSIED